MTKKTERQCLMSVGASTMDEIRGAAIKELIPQRDPMIMIDAFYDATESEADTGFTITEDNLFCGDDGLFAEPGLVEHIAQSASAFAGYKAKMANRPTPIGYIGELKKFRIHFLPRAGDELRTRIRILSEVLGVSLLTAETTVNGETAVQGQMKIYIKPSSN
jgi:3-hydroxymyristoyl/3-hydroxydecanoyl-(acyl carrier protein) dehydratase